jgi:crotonobetainyl-CoA:carnitine CoA-transferase CaiB-like acyl-CoA transferase
MTKLNSRNLPLAGIRVLELSEIWAGPYCGCLLGDMGAEVIKIESIQRIARGPLNSPEGAAQYPDGHPGAEPWNRFAIFNATNRNKKGLTLDLKTPKGRDAFKKLAAESDIILCNYARTVMENFQLSYEEIYEVNPKIIYMLMPGYGTTGPYKDYRSMGMAVDAISGHTFQRGYPKLQQSSNSVVHHPDAVAAINGTFALTTALIQRENTGEGQLIDLSQSESFMTHMGNMYLEEQMNESGIKRKGNRSTEYAPQGVYKCLGNDKWISISILNDLQWSKLAKLIDSNLMNNEKYNTKTKRLTSHDELDIIITAWTSKLDNYNAMNQLQTIGIPAGAVLNCGPDTYDDPHLNERDFFQIVEDSTAGIYPMSGPVIRFQNSSTEIIHNPAPSLGEHNEYILKNVLNYSDADIKELEKLEIIGKTPLKGSDMGGSRRLESKD